MMKAFIDRADAIDPSATDKLVYTAQEIATLRLWLALIRAARCLEGQINSRMLTDFGHGFTRFDAMSQLYRAPGRRLTIGELRNRLLIRPGNISRLLDRMQHDGLIVRQSNPHDRRSQDVALTAQGRAVFRKMAKAHARWVKQALAGVDEETLARLTTDLRSLA